MASNSIKPMGKAELLSGLALLGRPPVLSSEDEKHFEQLFWMVADCIKPENMIEVIYLWHFVCASWIIKRYMRHSTVAIERRYLAQRSLLPLRAKIRQARREDQVSHEVDKLVQTPPDIARLSQLEDNMIDLVKDTDAIHESAMLERQHNKALEQTIAFQERLNTLIISQTAIRNDALRQLELVRMGLGLRAEEATERILEGEFAEIKELPAAAEAPSITPAQGQSLTEGDLANAVPAADPSEPA
jgi:hypothetical protein